MALALLLMGAAGIAMASIYDEQAKIEVKSQKAKQGLDYEVDNDQIREDRYWGMNRHANVGSENIHSEETRLIRARDPASDKMRPVSRMLHWQDAHRKKVAHSHTLRSARGLV